MKEHVLDYTATARRTPVIIEITLPHALAMHEIIIYFCRG